MLRPATKQYICLKCISRTETFAQRISTSSGIACPRLLPLTTTQKRYASIGQKQRNTGTKYGRRNIPKEKPGEAAVIEQPVEVPIRQRLQQWVRDHEMEKTKALPPDMLLHGTISNSITRTQSTGSSELDNLKGVASSASESSTTDPEHEFSSTEPASIGSSYQRPGDLVELRQPGTRVPIFGIYLGNFGNRNHFYAVNGKWITSLGFSSLFSVSKFCSAEELEPVLCKIPQSGTPEQFDSLRANNQGPSREDAQTLIDKMTNFQRQAETIYQRNLQNLDGARALLADAKDVRYLSLFTMAEILLPDFLKRGDVFPPYALYAVHTAVYRSETGFYPLSPSRASQRRDHMFEVLPLNDTTVMDTVATIVREYTLTNMDKAAKSSVKRPYRTGALEQFAEEARVALAANGKKRNRTQYGILEPTNGVELEKFHWSPGSKNILQFLEWWASYDLFDASSRFHSYGATILRSLKSYKDVPLDQRTAWTFLQEVGIIQPWELPSRYRVRLPSTTIDRGAGLIRKEPVSLETSRRTDVAAGFRKDYSEAVVFCIDAASTLVIDDGISLERTEQIDEFWLHVHVADPASGIEPNSELCNFMELIPENIYLPGHFQAMLPSSIGGDDDSKDFHIKNLIRHYSLRNKSQALTFSAKVNTSGEILDLKIEPSTLGEVVYMDPEEVSKFCHEFEPSQPEGRSLIVGTPPKLRSFGPNRSMVIPESLAPQQQEDLQILHQLGNAVKSQRLAKGAWPYFFPQPSVSVSMHKPSTGHDKQEDSVLVPADPYIKVGTRSGSGCAVVANAMVLAGEIAARWCADRGVPVPYRRNVDTGYGFEPALEYATKELYPLIKQGIEPNAQQRDRLAKFTGTIEISSQPGPYFLLGLDMYAKATSPLRRFGDLVLHWQIHGALAHERAINRSLDAKTDNLDEILPFPSGKLAEMLPMLQVREKMGRAIARGARDWILIALVRAWRFENNPPQNIVFTVDSRWRQGLSGHLDVFGLNATLDIDGLDEVALINDIQANDKFEVELSDINVHSGQILVKALRRLERRE